MASIPLNSLPFFVRRLETERVNPSCGEGFTLLARPANEPPGATNTIAEPERVLCTTAHGGGATRPRPASSPGGRGRGLSRLAEVFDEDDVAGDVAAGEGELTAVAREGEGEEFVGAEVCEAARLAAGE